MIGKLLKIYGANLVFAVLVFSIFISCSDNSDTRAKEDMRISELFPDEIDGWMPSGDFETYDRDGIFTYIDGAGEVYRMYDFREVWVRQYRKNGAPQIIIEVFDMGKPEDAYGVYRHASRGGDAGIGQNSEFNGGLLSFWQGRFYITLLPEKLTDETRNAVLDAGKEIAGKIEDGGQAPKLVSYMPVENRIANSLKYFHLYTSLNYHYYLASENILDLSKDTDAALAVYEPDRTYLVLIEYPSPDKAAGARSSFISAYIPEAGEEGIYEIQSDSWTAIDRVDSYLVMVFDAVSKQACLDIINKVKNGLI
jgi:hypothetical protein